MITSAKNSRIVEARKLNQRKHRLRQNRFLVDGLQLLGMAVDNPQAQPLELFYCEAQFAGEMAAPLKARLIEAGAHPHSVAPHVMATLSERDTPQGLVATFALDSLMYGWDFFLAQLPASSSDLLVVLDRLQDPGNLGTLVRTADGVGASGVVLLEPCVDLFDPKTVRGTMGSLFNLPFTTIDHPHKLEALAQQRYHLIGADGRLGKPVWDVPAMQGRVALVLGNEARGLSEDIQPYFNSYVSLPLHGQAESLNVAIAGGVLMYEWLRVNRAVR